MGVCRGYLMGRPAPTIARITHLSPLPQAWGARTDLDFRFALGFRTTNLFSGIQIRLLGFIDRFHFGDFNDRQQFSSKICGL